MPLPLLRACAAVSVLLGACLLALSFAAVATAAKSKTVPAQLRVVDSKGRTLADQTQYTGKDGVSIRTDPKADCFGAGSGGSGKKLDVPGATAFGLLADAGPSDRRVRPLSVTDAFPDLGPGLCGVGRVVSPSTGFWYLKLNHEASQAGGGQTAVRKGDEVLWYLIDDFSAPVPDELLLMARARARAGSDIPVRVVSYADDGTRSAAAGVTVSGADAPTDEAGRTTVQADQPLLDLTAKRSGSIPSNTVHVCTQSASACPAGYATTTGGSRGDDRIKVARAATTVLAGGGGDRITARKGSVGDLFKCGGGKDEVSVSRKIKRRSGFSGCERIRVLR